MAENLFPLFVGKRVLRKEYLWALRDYSHEALKLHYEAYADGLISGFPIAVEDSKIRIGRGILKYGGEIFLWIQDEVIDYAPAENYLSLKISVCREPSMDYHLLTATPTLDSALTLQENEFELCRFKLKAGSQLRNDYVAFFDIETEFDTLNLVEASWASVQKKTLHPMITKIFSLEAMRQDAAEARDLVFCSACLQERQAVPRFMIEEYVKKRLQLEQESFTNRELFQSLDSILRILSIGGDRSTNKKRIGRRELFLG